MRKICTATVLLMMLLSLVSVQPVSQGLTDPRGDIDGKSLAASLDLSDQKPGNYSITSNSTTLGFNRSFGFGSLGDLAIEDMITDSQGNTYVAIYQQETQGYSSSFQIGSTHFYSSDEISHTIIAKFSSDYSAEWVINTSNLEDVKLDLTANESLVVGGRFSQNNGEILGRTASKQIFFATISHNGSLLRFVQKSGPTGISLHGFALDSHDAIYAYGQVSCSSCTVQTSFGTSSFYVAGWTDYFAKLNATGTWDWGIATTGNTWSLNANKVKLEIDSADNILFGTYLSWTGTASSKTFLGVQHFNVNPPGTSASGGGCVFMKMYENRSVQWVNKIGSTSSGNINCLSIDIGPNDDIIVTGSFDSPFYSLGTIISTIGGNDVFVSKYSSNGSLSWTKSFGSTGSEDISDVAVEPNGRISICGKVGGSLVIGNYTIQQYNTGLDQFLIQINNDSRFGTYTKSEGFGDEADCHMSHYLGKIFIGIKFRSQAKFSTFSQISLGDNDVAFYELTSDYDQDIQSDFVDLDDDNDGVIDSVDRCQFGKTDWVSNAVNDHDADGCNDSDEDLDDDNDDVEDDLDSCSLGSVNWISNNDTDLDQDGCQDAGEDNDDDNDGFIDLNDFCPSEYGNSTYSRETGCLDSDGDTRPDINDPFPNNSSEWNDADDDGVGDNEDAFPLDATQQSDWDGDSYGDNPFGTLGDACPSDIGNSTIDVFGCIDSDGDGWSDEGDSHPNNPTQQQDRDGDGYGDNPDGTMADAFPSDGTQWIDEDLDNHGDNPYGSEGDHFPEDPTRWQDSDRDGVADEDDEFVNDASQWNDTDGDGYGDEPTGNRADEFPDNPNEWKDSDGDGIGDNSDDFPFDPTQTVDSDGDGMGDNPMGLGADKFPDDATQWGDIDGDGYGDNQSGNNPDAFITDPTQWSDIDGDGYGDNPAGRMYDLFPEDSTQWLDEDGDGLGDNQSGNNPDLHLDDFDNDGFNDSIDPLPKLASPGDLDADGCLDEVDIFPSDPKECQDYDEDGIGDNSDPDDDEDGVLDTVEIQEGTDPMNSADKPIESFEVILPGTAVGLGAWDLIGVFGGIPLFCWIGFGLATRQSKTRRFEDELNSATSMDELFDIATRYERSLMWRLIGPHQALRLERIRTEIERDRFHISDQKAFPQISAGPDVSLQATSFDESYEWIDHEGSKWYRPISSGSEWTEWN